MSIIEVVAILAGAIWCATGWLIFFRRFMRDNNSLLNVDTWGDLAVIAFPAAAFGLFIAPLGPLPSGFRALAGRSDRSPRDVARLLAGESREDKLRRREWEVREREYAVLRLERELGIGQDTLAS